MHQHAPALAPHSNDVPQRAQARRWSGNVESVGAMLALSGVIARKINHAGMTVLRQHMYCVVPLSSHFLSELRGMAAAAISAYDTWSLLAAFVA